MDGGDGVCVCVCVCTFVCVLSLLQKLSIPIYIYKLLNAFYFALYKRAAATHFVFSTKNTDFCADIL